MLDSLCSLQTTYLVHTPHNAPFDPAALRDGPRTRLALRRHAAQGVRRRASEQGARLRPIQELVERGLRAWRRLVPLEDLAVRRHRQGRMG